VKMQFRHSLFLVLVFCSVTYTLKSQTFCTDIAHPTSFGRWGAYSFRIGDSLFIGGGKDSASNFLNDFWMYEIQKNKWTPKSNLPGKPRANGTSFVINNFGYVTCGRDSSGDLKDLWQYLPAQDSWARKADFPPNTRRYPIGLSFQNHGVVGLGAQVTTKITTYNDFWTYNASTDSWSYFSNLPGFGRAISFAFQIGNFAYIGGGLDSNDVGTNEIWEMNLVSGQWTQKSNFPGGERWGCFFSANDSFGFVGMGNPIPPSGDGEIWKYQPSSDKWEYKDPCEAMWGYLTIGFVIRNTLIFGTGYTRTIPMNTFKKYDLALGLPTMVQIGLESKPFPNPCQENIYIENKNPFDGTVNICNSVGKILMSQTLPKNSEMNLIQVGDLSDGLLFARVTFLNHTVSYVLIKN
jgi:N-acetylneuraminic acid mutarotase